MAKKVVATFKDKSKQLNLVKVIKAYKNEKGAYSYREEMVLADNVDTFLKTGVNPGTK